MEDSLGGSGNCPGFDIRKKGPATWQKILALEEQIRNLQAKEVAKRDQWAVV